jgi:hypothetical protein
MQGTHLNCEMCSQVNDRSRVGETEAAHARSRKCLRVAFGLLSANGAACQSEFTEDHTKLI